MNIIDDVSYKHAKFCYKIHYTLGYTKKQILMQFIDFKITYSDL
jgi:hypothetical protein